MPVVNGSAANFTVEILDPKTQTAGGVGIARYGNGQVRHFMMKGTPPEMITLPAEYLSHLNEKYIAVLNAQKAVNTSVDQAKKIEREYLYMACNGKYTIDGLNKETSNKICSWRDQFKEPYEKALAKYKNDLEQMKQRAETAEQQRLLQEQIQIKQRQIAVQESINAMGQMGQQMQNSSDQMLQSIMSQPPPQVIPMTPLGGNRVNCVTVGSVTNCR
jgi:hypothetical protein